MKIASALKSAMPDVVTFAGSTAVTYGAWLVYPPAGFIVGGLALIAAGVLVSLPAR